jgi:hypothetical protein
MDLRGKPMRDVYILGCGRSGTSMIAGSLAGAGYYMGEHLVEPRECNPKGFWESRQINQINEAIMVDAVPLRPEATDDPALRRIPLPKQQWLSVIDPSMRPRMKRDHQVDARITDAVSHRPYCYKDPRFCYTLDVWRPHLRGDEVFICVFRHPGAIAASILKHHAASRYLHSMDIDFDGAIAVFCSIYRWALDQPREGETWLFLHYEQALCGDGFKRIAELTGAPLDLQFADPALQRNRPDHRASDEAMRLYEQLCAKAGHGPG